MKSEPQPNAEGRLLHDRPEEYLSIDDLRVIKRAPWIGVRGYAARNFMRDDMQIGDLIIFYHSSASPSGPAGVAMVCSLSYPDFTQFDKHSKYFDIKATPEKPLWYMVDVEFVEQFARTISREVLRAVPQLADMKLWKQPRLSISDITKSEFEKIVALGKN